MRRRRTAAADNTGARRAEAVRAGQVTERDARSGLHGSTTNLHAANTGNNSPGANPNPGGRQN
jgi:hypothetical protein